jgi:ribosomal-protein-alanine N-acetyltransferase
VSLRIRPTKPADIAQLLAIEKECFASPNWGPGDFLKNECHVAEVDGEIVGFIVSREVFPGDADSATQREILNVATVPVYRRRGVATALIQHELRRRGEFFLEVRESNVAAQKVYRKLGFTEIGRRPKYYRSPVETAIVMQMK